MNFDDFVDALHASGWRPVCDAQHSEIRKLWDSWQARAQQAKAEPVAIPMVWIDPRDARRTMIAVPGERAEVSAHQEGRFTMPLYAAQEPTEPVWIPASESVPPLGQEVVVYCGHPTCGYRSDDQLDPENRDGWVVDWDGGSKPITHWMPLPQEPKA